MVTGRGKGGWEEVEQHKVGTNGDGKHFSLGDGYMMQYIEDVLLSCTCETCMALSSSVTPITSIKKSTVKKILGLDDFTCEFYQTVKELMLSFL